MDLVQNSHDQNFELKRYSVLAKLFDVAYFFSKLQDLRRITQSKGMSYPKPNTLTRSGHESTRLSELFNQYGSDKSSHHDYHLMYAEIVGAKRNDLRKIVEIGIGSIDLLTPQNMGSEGHPGASLRAFRDWAPNATVVGADIDPKTLFSEVRIQTCIVNQLERKTFTELKNIICDGADLVVIDGLHTPRADMNSLLELLPHLVSDGCLVIEDISPRAARLLWPVAKIVLRRKYSVALRQMKNGFVFIVLSTN